MIVIIIFIGIIGIIVPMIINSAVEYVRVTSLVFSFIGFLIIVTAWRWPVMRIGAFIGKSGGQKNPRYDTTGSVIIGASFMAGGLLYGWLKNYNAMIGAFLAGIVFYRLLTFYLNYIIKKR